MSRQRVLTHYLLHGAVPHAVAAGFSALNASPSIEKVDCEVCLDFYRENNEGSTR